MTTHLVLSFQLSIAEAQQAQMNTRFQCATISSGVYKQKIAKVPHDFIGPLLSEEQLLIREIYTMQQHIKAAEDHLNSAKEYLAHIKKEHQNEYRTT